MNRTKNLEEVLPSRNVFRIILERRKNDAYARVSDVYSTSSLTLSTGIMRAILCNKPRVIKLAQCSPKWTTIFTALLTFLEWTNFEKCDKYINIVQLFSHWKKISKDNSRSRKRRIDCFRHC